MQGSEVTLVCAFSIHRQQLMAELSLLVTCPPCSAGSELGNAGRVLGSHQFVCGYIWNAYKSLSIQRKKNGWYILS